MKTISGNYVQQDIEAYLNLVAARNKAQALAYEAQVALDAAIRKQDEARAALLKHTPVTPRDERHFLINGALVSISRTAGTPDSMVNVGIREIEVPYMTFLALHPKEEKA